MSYAHSIAQAHLGAAVHRERDRGVRDRVAVSFQPSAESPPRGGLSAYCACYALRMTGWIVLAGFTKACSTSGVGGADAALDGLCERLIPDATEYGCDALAPDAEGCIGDPNDPCCADSGAVYPVGCLATLPQASASDMNCRTSDMCGCHPQPAQCTSAPGVDSGPRWVRPL